MEQLLNFFLFGECLEHYLAAHVRHLIPWELSYVNDIYIFFWKY